MELTAHGLGITVYTARPYPVITVINCTDARYSLVAEAEIWASARQRCADMWVKVAWVKWRQEWRASCLVMHQICVRLLAYALLPHYIPQFAFSDKL